MSHMNNLRPVLVSDKGEKKKGFFHRFVYKISLNHSETTVLVELDDGHLQFFDPFFVQFLDRKTAKEKKDTTKFKKK